MLTTYRNKLKTMDRGQLLTEFEHVLDQLDQVRAGERAEVDWPIDGEPRPLWKMYSVGPAVPAKSERPNPLYRPDGTPYWPEKKTEGRK